MDKFNETKAIVEQFLCLKLGEASTTSKLTSELIKSIDEYLSRVSNNLTAFQCAKKLADLPNESIANEPKCMTLKSSKNQGFSKVSLYILRKQYRKFLLTINDPKDWNLIVKILNDLTEMAIDHMTIHGIDAIDNFVLTATDLIMNCPAQDGDSMYSSIRYIGGWEIFATNLTKIGCCSIETKPWGLLSSDYGLCLVCGTFWCKMDKNCHQTFFSYSRFITHRKNFIHETPTNFVKNCGRCGVEKDRTKSLFNRCNNCSVYFCTARDCSVIYDSFEWTKSIRNHYKGYHKKAISSDYYLSSIPSTVPRNCCSVDKKPPTKTVNDWGGCEICGRIWCRIDKSCSRVFLIASMFREHRQTKHDNPTNFTVECSNCGLKKVRTGGLYRKCQCIKYHCNVEGCEMESVLTTQLKLNFMKHYARRHSGLKI